MEKEKAQKIVELISLIAKGEATISINVFCGNAKNADSNRQLVEKWKNELVKLLTPDLVPQDKIN